MMNTKKQLSENVSENCSRHVKIDDWVFEVKMVRAFRVKKPSEPNSASAMANISLQGPTAYVDGVMQIDQQAISDNDVAALKAFCQQMGVEQFKMKT